ncbi:MAG: L-carnitine dehydratase/bile acid-inducible protein [Pseudomonas sp.]|uniref:hypothetical protein n=1 Tax=Pseudomonas sp. TaxID=306 RepID=UPI0026180CC9|nr:hypothetical protein [Pseudomonas sp.]MDB6050230.1 L-carnitine dehydratase/bile acid-inducible protein [Pseudomonas sp.]
MNEYSPFDTLQRLSQGGLAPLTKLMDELRLARHFDGDASLRGCDPIIRSPHRLGEASAVAQLLIGVAASSIWKARTGLSTDVASILSMLCTFCTRLISSSSKAGQSTSVPNTLM